MSELIGATAWIKREESENRAELLHERMRKGRIEFYVHYVEFNKRLDEWVDEARINLDKPVVKPIKKPEDEKDNKKKKESEEAGETQSEQPKEEEIDAAAALERLRKPDGLGHANSEIARVRNVNKIIFGEYEIEPWYFSPYPQEMTEEDQIYICEFTLQYFGSKVQFERWREKCTMRHPPGNEIYRDDKFSFYEIDGRAQRTYCRNLCLFSKLFLDHKTLYYDVDPFLFYCMVTRDEYGHHLVGYFSKEKDSAEGYNVACILSLPPYQRFGYGKILIDFSYNLSKKEGKLGSPEKPLSDLGLISYRSFWADILVELLVESGKSDVTVEDLSEKTSITTQDIMNTLQGLNMVRIYRGQSVVCLTTAAMERYERNKKRKRHRIDPAKLKWKPPVFTAAQLRFAW